MEVIQSMGDIQPRLMKLYTGPNKEVFAKIVPLCSRCDLIAYKAYSCFHCNNSIICGACYSKSHLACRDCEETKGNPAGKECVENKLAQSLLKEATFKCPNKCGEKTMTIQEFEVHVLQQCPLGIVFCTQECGRKVRRKDMAEHFQHDCMNTAVYCNQCGMGKGEENASERL